MLASDDYRQINAPLPSTAIHIHHRCGSARERTRAIEIYPRHGEAWFRKAIAEEVLGQVERAKESYRYGVEEVDATYLGQHLFAQERLAALRRGARPLGFSNRAAAS